MHHDHRSSSLLIWLPGDHLVLHSASRGDATLNTSADGTLISEQIYTTYPLRVLVGQRMDSFGLMDLNARYYAPCSGASSRPTVSLQMF
jgi:hypothetical protein